MSTEMTARQIAALAGGTVEGDEDVRVHTFAKIEEGVPGALSFLANAKYTSYIYTTGSSVVLVSRDFKPEHEVKATLIRVDDPYATVARLLQIVSEQLSPRRAGMEQPCHVGAGAEVPDDAWVAAFAYVGDRVKLGAGVQVYPHVWIGDGATIGDGTIIYAGVRIYPGVKIGKRCVIHSGAVIGADGFGFAPVGDRYEKIPQVGIVEIGDDVEIGANTTVDRATMGATVIGSGTKLDNLIQVAHNCRIGDNTVMAAQSGVAGSTQIGSNCMIAGQVGFVGHIKIGDRVQVGAQTGINRNVADGARVMGTPATDFSTWARQQAYLKQLPCLFDRVDQLINKHSEK